MYLFSHETTSWRVYPKLVTGAITYSEDIVKFQLPYWEQVLGPNDILSTAPPLDTIKLPSKIDNIIIYLHTWPYSEETLRVEKYTKSLTANIIFITAYKSYAEILKQKGYQAVYIPMSVDVEKIQQYQLPKAAHKRIIYYGNVSNYKRPLFREIKETCQKLNLELDVISWNTFMGQKLTHTDALKLVSTYSYGVGVGRAALEMMVFDIKQIIAGRQLGGLITNEEEFELQRAVNMNGRINTYSEDLSDCLLNIDKAICKIPPILNHAKEVLNQYTLTR